MTSALNTTVDGGNAASSLHHLRSMMRVRVAEERILQLRSDDLIAGSVHPCIGQECVPVAVGAHLDERDRVVATYRGHGWALARGVPLQALFAEVMGKATGTNGGRGGSPYLTAPELGFVGENSIVGAGLPIANGVAMGLAGRGDGGIAVVSFGDGATNQGASHEALVFAIARRLPILFVCENNDWSEMTPITDTVPHAAISDRAAGYGMRAAQVDGSEFGELFATAGRIVSEIRGGSGPQFLEVRVPRLLGHYNADLQLYRSDEDKQEHARRDPVARLTELLISDGQLDHDGVVQLRQEVAAEVEAAVTEALQAPEPDAATATHHVVGVSRIQPVGPLPTEGKELAYGLAVNRALTEEMAQRSEMQIFGEDIGVAGGTFGVTRNLRKTFGERVFDTPISEAAILGAALGASITGMRPVVEIMWSDFLLVAFDQIANQAANVRYLSRGQVTAPMVVRMQQGITPGSCAQHSQSLEALIAHIPGIKVGLPSCAADAYAMTRAAIEDEDPVVLIESRALYLNKGYIDPDAPVEPVGGARLRREGSDVLLITWGRMTEHCLAAADLLQSHGTDAAVLDLRWLAPLDEEAIAQAVALVGGKVLVVHEANVTGGFGAEIAARLSERHFAALAAPIRRVGLPDVRVPAAPSLQQALLPTPERIAEAALGLLASVAP